MKLFRLLLVATLLSSLFLIPPPSLVKAAGRVWRVPEDYPYVSNVLVFAQDGDVVRVSNGTYDGELLINKRVAIEGAGKDKTILGNMTCQVDGVTIKDVKLTNVTLRNSCVLESTLVSGLQKITVNGNSNVIKFNEFESEVLVLGDTNDIYGNVFTGSNALDISGTGNKIHSNTIIVPGEGIDGTELMSSFIYSNNITSVGKGINLLKSRDNVLDNNTIVTRKVSVDVKDKGIYLFDSNYNTIKYNTVTSDYEAIEIAGTSTDTTVYLNVVKNATNGIHIVTQFRNFIYLNNVTGINGIVATVWSRFNEIYKNNMFNTGLNAKDDGNSNVWHKYGKGNYYSKLVKTDADGDGVFDTQYVLPGANLSMDLYPLVSPYNPKPLFEVRDLILDPDQVPAGTNSTFSVNTWNIGERRASYTVILKINGVQEASKVVELDIQTSALVTFVSLKKTPGNYNVTVNNLSKIWQVLAIPKLPTSMTIQLSKDKLDLGEHLIVTGFLEPALAGRLIVIEYTDPSGKPEKITSTTNASGRFMSEYTPNLVNSWSVKASWEGDDDYTGSVSTSKTFTVQPPPPPEGNIQLTIKDAKGATVSGVTVVAQTKPTNQTALNATSNANGQVIFNKVKPGSYTFTCSKSGYESGTTSLTVEVGKTTEQTATIKVVEPPTGIPGYSYEAIVLGLVIFVILVYMKRIHF